MNPQPAKGNRMEALFNYNRLREHIGHSIACVCYGRDGQDPYNVSIECEDCCIVLMDANHPDVEEGNEHLL